MAFVIGVLPLAFVLKARLGHGCSMCVLCGLEKKIILHLFLECQFTKGLPCESTKV